MASGSSQSSSYRYHASSSSGSSQSQPSTSNYSSASGSSQSRPSTYRYSPSSGSSQSQPSTSRYSASPYSRPPSSRYYTPPAPDLPQPSISRLLQSATPVVQARFKFPYKVARPVARETVYLLAPTQNYYVALSRSLSNIKVKINKTLTKEIALEKKRKAEAAAKLVKPKRIRKIIV